MDCSGKIILLISFVCVTRICNGQLDNTNTRNGKALSIFQVVRFPNTGCTGGSSSKNGTCYTSSECTTKGGTNSGTCASGFGVCCTFTLGCGGTSNQNCTYFDSTGTPPSGQCTAKICKCNSDVCQLRIDMNTFIINGPNTLTLTVGYELGGGATLTAAGKKVTLQTQCNTDTFSITGGGGSAPPVICGTNSGYHIYVDASDSCNTMGFQFGQSAVGTALQTRSWSMKVTQISCFDANQAPSGCTNYLYGSTSGVIQSFNFANGVQLANQNQNVCIRRERGYCRICFSQTVGTDFNVSGKTATVSGFNKSSCCGYGVAGVLTMGFDCVMIPGATKLTGKTQLNNNFCGHYLVSINGNNPPKSICTMQTPFQLSFLTDNWTMGTAVSQAKGFRLAYWQTTC